VPFVKVGGAVWDLCDRAGCGAFHDRARTATLANMLERGSKAPDFTAIDENGNERHLADYSGKTLVLWFYPKADTPG